MELRSVDINKGQYLECLDSINSGIKIELSNNKKIDKINKNLEKPLLWYIRLLWNLKLWRYDEVQEDYDFLAPAVKTKEGQQLCKYIFGIILLPVEVDRKRIIDCIEGLNDIWNYYEKSNEQTRILNKHYFYDGGWEKNKTLLAAKKLWELSFFKRFDPKI